MPELELRASKPEDASAIVQLCRQRLSVAEDSPMFQPALMHWKYWAPWPGWSPARAYVVTRGGEVLAHVAGLPIQYRRGTRSWTLLHPLDWAASTELVGLGAVVLQRLSEAADGLIAVGGSSMTRRLLVPLGFRPLPDVGRFAARPTRESPGGVALRTLESGEASPSLEERFAPDVTALRWPALHAHWGACPALQSVARGVLDAGRELGGFVLGLTPGQARILDVWCNGAEPAGWARVFQAARFEAASHAGAAEVVTLANTPLERQALLLAGFELRGSLPLHVQTRDAAVAELGTRFQLLDGDAAFLHDGRPESWFDPAL